MTRAVVRASDQVSQTVLELDGAPYRTTSWFMAGVSVQTASELPLFLFLRLGAFVLLVRGFFSLFVLSLSRSDEAI
jgi:hypothetical protein